MELSVIIPTYNRREALRLCLDALRRQAWAGPAFEVIVGDDGSTDGTQEMLEKLPRSGPFELEYFRIGHKGPAAVRNEGLRRAKGKVLLYIGDDIIAAPSLAAEHVQWHKDNPEPATAVLGYVTWSRDLRISPFMYWLEHGGPCFRYYQFRHGDPVDALWTCNISFKREFLISSGGFFDEEFRYAAMEDIELGYRLKGSGLKILYNEAAAGSHLHPTDILRHSRRQLLAGRSTRLFFDKHPSAATPFRSMPAWKKAVFLMSPALKWVIYAADASGIGLDPRIYDLVLEYYFRKGFYGG